MKASAELSLYPLVENYKERITDFVLRLKKHPGLEVRTNGMSTQIFGEYDDIMDLLKRELGTELDQHRTMAIIKIGDGLMHAEDIPEELK